MSRKQRIILDFLRRTGGRMTLTEAVAEVGGDILHNKSKHVGAILSNMVKRGYIIRVEPGIFELPKAPEAISFTALATEARPCGGREVVNNPVTVRVEEGR